MSQLPDLYSSSLYEGDILDPRSCFQSDDVNLFTSEPSVSQQTIVSVLESDFTRPLSVPSSLQRVSPGRTKTWILYSEMSKDEFIEWWL